jgi:hypothetical protein
MGGMQWARPTRIACLILFLCSAPLWMSLKGEFIWTDRSDILGVVAHVYREDGLLKPVIE